MVEAEKDEKDECASSLREARVAAGKAKLRGEKRARESAKVARNEKRRE